MRDNEMKVQKLALLLTKTARDELNQKTHLHKIQKHNAEIIRLVQKLNAKNSQHYYGA